MMPLYEHVLRIAPLQLVGIRATFLQICATTTWRIMSSERSLRLSASALSRPLTLGDLMSKTNQNRSVPEMLGKLSRPDFPAEDIAHRVNGNAFGGARALHLNRIW